MWTADAGPMLGGALSGVWIVVAAVLLPRHVGVARGTQLPVLAASWLAVTLLAGHLAVVDVVEDSSAVALLDAPMHAWFVGHRTGLLDPLMVAVSAVGGTAGIAVLTAVAAALLLLYRRHTHAAFVVIAFVGGELLTEGAKLLYQRARPPVADQLTPGATSYALPSGHALGAIVVVGAVAAVAVQVGPGRARRPAVVVLAAAVVLLIGASRLYLGVHWPTDVMSGYLLGGAWLAICVGGLTVVERRHARALAPAGSLPAPS
jgi:membrane-associated phospholipid phosphatase